MFKHLLVLFSLFVPLAGAYAQLFDMDKKLFSDEPFFNPFFVKQHKIKSITGEFHYKPDNEKMRPKGTYTIYEFDGNGLMERQTSVIRMPGGEMDTAFIYFEYDSAGRLATKRTTDNFGFYSLSYTYDERGNVVEEVFNRELNATASKGNFVLARQYPMGIERYEIVYFSPAFFKKKFFNNLGTAFKEVSYAFNGQGKLIEETGTLLTTRMLERKTYKYNELGQLTEKTEYSDFSRNTELLYTYRYDEKGNLVEHTKLKNNEAIMSTEFMLDEKGLVSAKISRDQVAKMIDVVKFTYEFY